MSESFEVRWMEGSDSILILKSPADPDWQAVADGFHRAFEEAGKAAHEVDMIFDVTLSPDPPDPRIISKLSGLMASYPRNLKTIIFYGSNEKNKRALGILSRTLIPIIKVADTMDESIAIINTRRVAV